MQQVLQDLPYLGHLRQPCIHADEMLAVATALACAFVMPTAAPSRVAAPMMQVAAEPARAVLEAVVRQAAWAEAVRAVELKAIAARLAKTIAVAMEAGVVVTEAEAAAVLEVLVRHAA